MLGAHVSLEKGANADTTDAEGVLLAQGHRFGGYGLYMKDGYLKFVYNYLGKKEQMLISEEKLKPGEYILGAEFKLDHIDKENSRAVGTFRLFVNDKKVAEYPNACTQLGKFALAGEGLTVGYDSGDPVTTDYPGDQPWSFKGGKITKVAVDLSGEPYVDLELEAQAMMSRE